MKQLILVFLLSLSGWAEGLFQSMTYEQALEASRQAGKPLLVEWTATWCAPCKVMQKTTFQEAQVIEFCQKEFVPVQFDLDRDSELAKTLRVQTVPTLLYIREGQEVDRCSGLKTAPELLDWLSHLGKGPNQFEVFKAAVEAKPSDAQARWQLAEAYQERQMWEEASQQALWLWDQVDLLQQQSMAAVRQSFLANSLKRLAKAHAPTELALQQRLEFLQQSLASASSAQLADWLKLHEILGTESQAAQSILEQPELFRALPREVFVLLCSQGHWARAGQWLENPSEYAQQIWAGRLKLEEKAQQLVAPASDMTRSFARRSSYRQWGDLIRALNEGGRAPEAVEIRYWIRSQDPEAPL
jgi:thiol-disulfide isomerase/thioredoxin